MEDSFDDLIDYMLEAFRITDFSVQECKVAIDFGVALMKAEKKLGKQEKR